MLEIMVGVVVVVLAFIWWCRRRKKQQLIAEISEPVIAELSALAANPERDLTPAIDALTLAERKNRRGDFSQAALVARCGLYVLEDPGFAPATAARLMGDSHKYGWDFEGRGPQYLPAQGMALAAFIWASCGATYLAAAALNLAEKLEASASELAPTKTALANLIGE